MDINFFQISFKDEFIVFRAEAIRLCTASVSFIERIIVFDRKACEAEAETEHETD